MHDPGPRRPDVAVGGILRAPVATLTTQFIRDELDCTSHTCGQLPFPEWFIVAIVALEAVPTEGIGARALTVLVVLRRCSLPACRASETSLGSA